ncbi:MAG: hypothetical protein JWL73_3647 [Actinomycetia bacterium]|nr:hypothetical protein [Actinomycetes bacterium]
MSDPIAEDLISAYVDDELDAPTRAAVERAIDDTPALAGVLLEVVEAREAVRLLPMVDLPNDALRAVMAHVAAADPIAEAAAPTTTAPSAQTAASSPVDEVARSRRRRVRAQRWLAGAAAAVILLVVLVATPQPRQVTPTVGRLVDNHAARVSDDTDPTSQLATLAAAAPMALFR